MLSLEGVPFYAIIYKRYGMPLHIIEEIVLNIDEAQQYAYFPFFCPWFILGFNIYTFNSSGGVQRVRPEIRLLNGDRVMYIYLNMATYRNPCTIIQYYDYV